MTEHLTKGHETVVHKGVRIPIIPELMSPKIIGVLRAGTYEHGEADNLAKILDPGEVILEVGAGIGFISTVAALNPKTERIEIFEANPSLRELIEKVHRINQVDKVVVNTGVLMHDSPTSTVPFYIRQDFWSSSLSPGNGKPPRHVDVPVFDLNETLRRIRPTMIICDIEGGEWDLFQHADLSCVKKVVVEIHQNVLGRKNVQRLFDAFSAKGFVYDQDFSHGSVIFFCTPDRELRRHRPKSTETKANAGTGEKTAIPSADVTASPARSIGGKLGGLLGISRSTRQYHVFLGAHENGTSFIRECLKDRQNRLADARILLASPADPGANLARAGKFPWKKKWPKTPAGAARALLPDLASPEFRQAARIVICDDNLPGTLPALRLENTYEHARERLQAFRHGLNGTAKAFFCVREPAGFFEAVYWKLLMLKGYVPFDEFLEKSAALKFSWLPLYHDISAAFGAGNVVVFGFDTLISNPSAVVSKILGTHAEIDGVFTPFQPTASAVEYIRIEQEWKSDRENLEVARAAKARYPSEKGNPAFAPWTDEQSEILRKNYEADLARLPLWQPGARG